jgi:hypothetical protein
LNETLESDVIEGIVKKHRTFRGSIEYVKHQRSGMVSRSPRHSQVAEATSMPSCERTLFGK